MLESVVTIMGVLIVLTFCLYEVISMFLAATQKRNHTDIFGVLNPDEFL